MSDIERWVIHNAPMGHMTDDKECRVQWVGDSRAVTYRGGIEVVPADRLAGAVDLLRKIAADEGVVHDGIIDTDVPRRMAQAYLDALGGQ